MKNKTVSTAETWFAGGLRFGCRRCGACCTGEPGYVYVSAGESRRIAAFLGVAHALFLARYTRKVEERRSLTELEDGRCFFFEEAGCRIYGVRPAQCRSFPFWLSNLVSRRDWISLSRDCPGVDSGRHYSYEEICARLGDPERSASSNE